ncbi:MAG: hypothetical protein ACYDHW_14000 [Syntrophorhabdaceae bacterium]
MASGTLSADMSTKTFILETIVEKASCLREISFLPSVAALMISGHG